jgi:hypothetical protein
MFAFASGHLMYDALTKKKIITNILSEKDTESFVLASSLRKEFDEYKEESLGREGLLKQQFIDTVSFYEGELKKLNIQIECLTVDAKLEKGTGFPEEPPSTDVKSEVVAYASTKKPKNTKAKAKV